ncbi:MAG: preprotein translocase subunit SecY [Thermoflexales bacterium]|nr:preprotein translocase subunit SecY [Thermoflexales bacterium]MCS7324616.1 preprotein translocase subunit SecY [Thermoflexales bacterium]MDW8053837.1 preprotein translocase subunit SecY [Anaerolineae bacterium]MDW8292368.1 preprotein translocase subunit SecY [Anaerolineae bacterium]
MLQAIRSAITLPEIRNRILFTLFILVIYRLVSHVPVPGVDPEVLRQIRQAVEAGQAGGLGSLVGLLNLLSGGAVFNFSVLAMGVYPYVTASIILQLLIPVIPRLEELAKEGEQGRRKINRLTYFLTVPMAALNAIGQVNIFESIGAGLTNGQRVLPQWGLDRPEYILPTIVTIVTMTAGTMFAVWLGELITEQGIGQGLSIIIFGGIVARIPANVAQIAAGLTPVLTLAAFLVITVITVLGIVYIQEGERRIPVQYGRRVRGRRIVGGVGTHIPLKVNSAGMIPIIFAQAVLVFPAIIAGFFVNSRDAGVQNFAVGVVRLFSAGQTNQNVLSAEMVFYTISYFLLVIGFTYFYTDVMMQQQNLAENLQKQGGFIPGIRPGKSTETFITRVTRRLTLVGALFLGLLAILPYLLNFVSYVPPFGFLRPVGNNNLLLSGAGLLIVVGVVLDTMRQLQAQLLMRNYEGFIK